VVFFEVPNVLYTLRDLGIWDLIYEHCSYFSPPSLSHLFRASGFDIRKEEELYEGQFLGIDALPSARPSATGRPDNLGEIHHLVDRFAAAYLDKVESWGDEFTRLRAAGAKVAVWGGGSKGVMFLNTLRPGDAVTCMVDINPRKQGMFVAGVGVPVVAPHALTKLCPDIVVVMNPIYRDEIRESLERLGIGARIVEA
jgi:hypothetical protein